MGFYCLCNFSGLFANMTAQDAREWTAFLFMIVGGSLALRTYIVNQQQRRLENTLKLIERFWAAVSKEDLGEWINMYRASSECAGATEGHFVDEASNQCSLDELFVEGPADKGATDRIVQELNIISQEILEKTINPRMIYFELGQFIKVIHGWLASIDKQSNDGLSLLDDHFSAFGKAYQKYKCKFDKWPHKIIAYIE